MIKHLTIIFPYYEAPGMLTHQMVSSWNLWPNSIADRLTLILIDDGSQRFPAEWVYQEYCKEGFPFEFRLYRVKEDIPWNQHGARNLGAKEAPGGWLLLSDIDHTFGGLQLLRLMEKDLNPDWFYTMNRLTATIKEEAGERWMAITPMLDQFGRPKPHPNTFILTKDMFWRAGGYDEDYCGTYGGDGPFRKWLDRIAKHGHLKDIHSIRWPREVIPDASQPPEFRNKYKPLYKPKFNSKGGGKAPKPTSWLRFNWERVL